MRILSGTLKGRVLQRPQSQTTRPTASRVRESLFNILAHGALDTFEGITVLDAFAGSGSLGFESLSRGASQAWFWDINPRVLSVVIANARALGVESQCVIQLKSALNPPMAQAPVDLIFLDPPYGQGLIEKALDQLGQKGWIGGATLIVMEVAEKEPLDLKGYDILKERPQGPARLVFVTANRG